MIVQAMVAVRTGRVSVKQDGLDLPACHVSPLYKFMRNFEFRFSSLFLPYLFYIFSCFTLTVYFFLILSWTYACL